MVELRPPTQDDIRAHASTRQTSGGRGEFVVSIGVRCAVDTAGSDGKVAGGILRERFRMRSTEWPGRWWWWWEEWLAAKSDSLVLRR